MSGTEPWMMKLAQQVDIGSWRFRASHIWLCVWSVFYYFTYTGGLYFLYLAYWLRNILSLFLWSCVCSRGFSFLFAILCWNSFFSLCFWVHIVPNSLWSNVYELFIYDEDHAHTERVSKFDIGEPEWVHIYVTRDKTNFQPKFAKVIPYSGAWLAKSRSWRLKYSEHGRSCLKLAPEISTTW